MENSESRDKFYNVFVTQIINKSNPHIEEFRKLLLAEYGDEADKYWKILEDCKEIKDVCSRKNFSREVVKSLINEYYSGGSSLDEILEKAENIQKHNEINIILNDKVYEFIPETVKDRIRNHYKGEVSRLVNICAQLTGVAVLQIAKKFPIADREKQLLECYLDESKVNEVIELLMNFDPFKITDNEEYIIIRRAMKTAEVIVEIEQDTLTEDDKFWRIGNLVDSITESEKKKIKEEMLRRLAISNEEKRKKGMDESIIYGEEDPHAIKEEIFHELDIEEYIKDRVWPTSVEYASHNETKSDSSERNRQIMDKMLKYGLSQNEILCLDAIINEEMIGKLRKQEDLTEICKILIKILKDRNIYEARRLPIFEKSTKAFSIDENGNAHFGGDAADDFGDK